MIFDLIPAFSSLANQAGEQALPHLTQREMSSVMGLLRTTLKGRKTGLTCHTPGLWVASQPRQTSDGLGVLLHAH